MPPALDTAHDEVWHALQVGLGQRLAPRLRDLLQRFAGHAYGEYVRLYAVDELAERNQTYEVPVYCPGWLTIGDDGGGRALMVSANLATTAVFIVDHGCMTVDTFEAVAADLTEWVEQGCPLPED